MNHGAVHVTVRPLSLLLIAVLALFLPIRGLASEMYRLHASFSGQAQGTILLIFRYRVYYEAAAGLLLRAEEDGKEGQIFQFEGVATPAYVMRTLGFSGKALAVMSAYTDYTKGDIFAKQRVLDWERECPQYAKYIRKVKRLPFLVENAAPQSWSFRRSSAGRVSDAHSRLILRYKHHPQEIGIYFRVYALIAEMMGFYNHGVWPDSTERLPARLPESWFSVPIDLTDQLTRVGAQTEKIVASAVNFAQEEPFVLQYSVVHQDENLLEIRGRNTSRPGIWKSFVLIRFERNLRINRKDQKLLRDEIQLLIENGKGQRGKGVLLLERQNS